MDAGFIAGGISGFTQVWIGYPLDTWRVWTQRGLGRPPLKKCWRGIQYPLVSSTAINGVMFGTNHIMREWTDNQWITGAGAGAVSSVICSPVEFYKIRRQLGETTRIQNAFRGFRWTGLRETLSCSIYFGVYDWLRRKTDNIPLSGAGAGVLCWGAVHPIDTIKTRIQANDAVTWRMALERGGLWRGVGISMGRASLVNSLGFYVYEKALSGLSN